MIAQQPVPVMPEQILSSFSRDDRTADDGRSAMTVLGETLNEAISPSFCRTLEASRLAMADEEPLSP